MQIAILEKRMQDRYIFFNIFKALIKNWKQTGNISLIRFTDLSMLVFL